MQGAALVAVPKPAECRGMIYYAPHENEKNKNIITNKTVYTKQ